MDQRTRKRDGCHYCPLNLRSAGSHRVPSESGVALHESFDAAQAHVETELKERVPSILSQVICKRYDGRVFIFWERLKLAAGKSICRRRANADRCGSTDRSFCNAEV